jgi:uncharacterized membrane protein
MGSKKIITSLIILLILPIVLAQTFSLYESSQPGPLCPGATGIYTDTIENTGTGPISLSISTSGSASSFSTSVPLSMTLIPGQTKNIYTYVTPRSTTTPGAYSLRVMADANGETRELTHDIVIKDCYEFSLEALDIQKNVCPCESGKFEFLLTNYGDYTESYSLEVDGEYASNIVLSATEITLSPGEADYIFAYVTTLCNDVGQKDFTLKATSLNSGSIQATTSTLLIDPCYDFSIATERDLVNTCEHTQETIDITIQNSGSTTNEYSLNIDGPLWANLERNTLTINPNSQATTTLVLNPDYGVEGSFELDMTVQPDKGEVVAHHYFDVNIRKCHGVSLNIEKAEDKMCNSLQNTYAVSVINTGDYSKEYYFAIDGPSWATLDKSSANLGVGEETQLTLTINPTFDTPEAAYSIKVQAIAKDSSQVASTDKIDITTVSKDECYKAIIGLDQKKIDVYYDSTATLPIVIENKGAYTTSYDLGLSGTASNFVYLNPATVEINPGQSEIVYLYIAPSGQIKNGDYSVTIAARLADSSVMASETVTVVVSDSGYIAPEDLEEKESIFTKIINFFKNLFKPNLEEGPIDEEEIEEIIEEPIIDEETIENETIDEEIEEIEEEVEEIITTENGFLLNLGESGEFIIKGETHTIELTDISDDTILITLSSDPILFTIDVGESKDVDMDNDGIYDVKVTFNGYVDGKADISYEEISEEVTDEPVEEEIIEEETSDEETDGEEEPFFSSFFGSLGSIFTGAGSSLVTYKYHIIGIIAVIIILYLIFKTGFAKRIGEFFEEEIEEEDVPVVDKKEEPKEEPKEEKPAKKKEEKPKKATKKTKKEKTEDTEDEIEIEGLDEESNKEDFIIEFDDDEDEKKK